MKRFGVSSESGGSIAVTAGYVNSGHMLIETKKGSMDARAVLSSEGMSETELVVDRIYIGGTKGNAGDDPLPALVGVSNQGGFRYLGSLNAIRLLVLRTSEGDATWPDLLERESGSLTYYGDNRKPGRDLHGTPRHGNEILRDLFNQDFSREDIRRSVPPILVFSATGVGRDVVFCGLAVPGGPRGTSDEDLTAVWRTVSGQRFQNYRASFTILDASSISLDWVRGLSKSNQVDGSAPDAWRRWVTTGRAAPLLAPRSMKHRTRAQQTPSTSGDRALLQVVAEYFSFDPYAFEAFAAEIVRFHIPGISELELTRRSRDGGRDVIGRLLLGGGPSSVLIDFAIEAKCYGANHGVGVRDLSRLISRLRHRQFGVLVTTSYLSEQAYQELVADEHPVIVIGGADIVGILRTNNLGDRARLKTWLRLRFPDARTKSSSD